MYVCLCNLVTDGEIKKWVETFPHEPTQNCLDKLKIGTNCGLCKNEACRLLTSTGKAGVEEKKVS